MKQFFKMMFASALGVFVAICFVFMIGIFILIGMVASLDSSPEYLPKPNTVLKISLSGPLPDNVEENPLAILMGETKAPLSVRDVLKSINVAKENSSIKGIYLEAVDLSAGTASIDIIRRALVDFKESGKFVVAYSDAYTQGCYYLCSVADKVFLNPQGVLAITGFSSQTIFWKGLLHKAGIDMQVFKVGTYKGFVEPFTLDKLSDENREQISSYQKTIWQNICEGIAVSRKITELDVDAFADNGLMLSSAEKFVELGFIDELKYKSDVEDYVKELAGQTGNQLKVTGVDKMKNAREYQGSSKNQIAIVYAEGDIKMEQASSPYRTEQAITENVARELKKLRKDDNVKAVVFRVNSPGGSAFISDQIWHEVVELKKVKPIVVSMGSVAASGGYYISCAANKIIAEANTITGSIGIFGMFPNATGLFGKLDLKTDIVKTNKYADMGDLSRPMRDDEKAIMQAYIEKGYDTFITRCAEGRNMTKEAINEIAQGRVWTGEQALENGLVDELGGIDEAVIAAAGLANIDDFNIVNVSTIKDFFKDFMDKQIDDVKYSITKSVLGDEYELVKTIQHIKSTTGIQARLPYDVQPL